MTEEQVIRLFKCLSDKSRLQIVKNLIREPMYVELLAERLELSPSTISFHLKKLTDAGLVKSSKDQYYIIYSINDEVLKHNLEALICIESTQQQVQEAREKQYRDKIIGSFFEMGKLKSIPVQIEKRKVILSELAEAFEPGRSYAEREVNLILADYYDDFCTLRKYMAEEGILVRKDGIYVLNGQEGSAEGSTGETD